MFCKNNKKRLFGFSMEINFFPYLEFYFLGFDSIFSLVPVLLAVFEDL